MSNMTSPGSGNLELMQRIEALENENKQLKDANEFSFEERRIGSWIDGKPLYRKMVDFGDLPSNATKTVELNIPGIAHCHINLGHSMWITGTSSFSFATTTFTFIHNYIISLNTGTNKVSARTNSAEAAKYKALICIEYTKTTD